MRRFNPVRVNITELLQSLLLAAQAFRFRTSICPPPGGLVHRAAPSCVLEARARPVRKKQIFKPNDPRDRPGFHLPGTAATGAPAGESLRVRRPHQRHASPRNRPVARPRHQTARFRIPGGSSFRRLPGRRPPPRGHRVPPRAAEPRPFAAAARYGLGPGEQHSNSGRTGRGWKAACRHGRGRRAAHGRLWPTLRPTGMLMQRRAARPSTTAGECSGTRSPWRSHRRSLRVLRPPGRGSPASRTW